MIDTIEDAREAIRELGYLTLYSTPSQAWFQTSATPIECENDEPEDIVRFEVGEWLVDAHEVVEVAHGPYQGGWAVSYRLTEEARR